MEEDDTQYIITIIVIVSIIVYTFIYRGMERSKKSRIPGKVIVKPLKIRTTQGAPNKAIAPMDMHVHIKNIEFHTIGVRFFVSV